MIIILDPGSITGWAIFQNGKYRDSGAIYTNNTKGNKCVYIRQELMKILVEYQPTRAYIEKKGEYAITVKLKDKYGKYFRKNLEKQNQMYSAYWETVNAVISEWGIPCVDLDTRRLAKKKIAQLRAKEISGKTRISTHEAEAICWGEWIITKEKL